MSNVLKNALARYFVPYTYPLTPGITYCTEQARSGSTNANIA